MHVIQAWISRHHYIWTVESNDKWDIMRSNTRNKANRTENMFNINLKRIRWKAPEKWKQLFFSIIPYDPTYSVWNSYIHDVYAHSFICKNKRRKLKVISQLKKSLHCDFIFSFSFLGYKKNETEKEISFRIKMRIFML